MDFEPMYPGFESREYHDFFVIIIIIFYDFLSLLLQCKFANSNSIHDYCLYSVSPTLLPLMIPRPPAPSAL